MLCALGHFLAEIYAYPDVDERRELCDFANLIPVVNDIHSTTDKYGVLFGDDH